LLLSAPPRTARYCADNQSGVARASVNLEFACVAAKLLKAVGSLSSRPSSGSAQWVTDRCGCVLAALFRLRYSRRGSTRTVIRRPSRRSPSPIGAAILGNLPGLMPHPDLRWVRDVNRRVGVSIARPGDPAGHFAGCRQRPLRSLDFSSYVRKSVGREVRSGSQWES
jgi:hypothetical protein